MPDRFGDPAEQPKVFTRPKINPLTVACAWCKASVGNRCVVPGTGVALVKSPAHDVRMRAAELAATGALAKGRMS